MNVFAKVGVMFVTLTLTLVIVTKAQQIYAHNESGLAHKLAVRFELNESEVDKFLEDYYRERSEVDIDGDTTDEHLRFVENKLNKGVADGWITKDQKRAVINKLRQMMDKGPTVSEYRVMSSQDMTTEINKWKADMRKWARSQNLTLDQIRNLTGKGNKYLMGVELE